MISDKHAYSKTLRGHHTRVTRDSVVDGDNQIGFAVRGKRDDLGRQPVAEFKPVGNQIRHLFQPELTQD